MSNRKYKIGGTWGARVSWDDPVQFNKPFDTRTIFTCNGHYTPRPRVGDTLKGEFEKSIIWFVFTKVKNCLDPTDQFFAEVKPTRQVMNKA